MRFSPFSASLLAVFALISVSCATSQVDRAFDGEMETPEEIRVVTGYCQGCHVHRDFNPGEHIPKAAAMYEKEPYASAADCKTCHSIRRNFWNDIVKRTEFPRGRLVDEQG